jgi:hypothetical protein
MDKSPQLSACESDNHDDLEQLFKTQHRLFRKLDPKTGDTIDLIPEYLQAVSLNIHY